MVLLASPAHSGGVCPLPAGLIIELRLSVLFHWGGQWNYTIIEITPFALYQGSFCLL